MATFFFICFSKMGLYLGCFAAKLQSGKERKCSNPVSIFDGKETNQVGSVVIPRERNDCIN